MTMQAAAMALKHAKVTEHITYKNGGDIGEKKEDKKD